MYSLRVSTGDRHTPPFRRDGLSMSLDFILTRIPIVPAALQHSGDRKFGDDSPTTTLEQAVSLDPTSRKILSKSPAVIAF